MYKTVTFLLGTFLYVNCGFAQVKTMNNPENTLTQKEKTDGWKLLFDGKTSNGWHTYGKQTAGKVWSVKDGAFYLDAESKKSLGAGEGGDLVTNEEYGNFDLKLDSKEIVVLYFIYMKTLQNILRLMKQEWKCRYWITVRLHAGAMMMQDPIRTVPAIYMIC